MNCCDCELYGPCNGRHGCAVRPAAVTRVKVSHCTRAEPVIPQPTPERRAVEDELPMGKWDRFCFWGVLAVTGSCTILVVFGSAGWAYTRWIA